MDALKPYWLEIKFALWAFVLTAVFLAGHHVGGLRAREQLAKADQHTAEQTTKASEAARDTEHTQANDFAAIDVKFTGDMRYAQALSASTVAGLHAGTVRLSPTWRCAAAGVPATAADPGAVDAANRLREESAGRIIGLVASLQAERDAALDKLAAERK